MNTPKLLFGAGGIGTTANSFTFTWDTPEAVSSLLDTLQDLGITELDSAASYPPGNPWNTETLLGQAKAGERGFVIDTKVAAHDGNLLNEHGISSSIDKSLALLGMSSVHGLYSHTPDLKTPIEETAAAYHKQYLAGKFKKLGICNYSTTQVAEFLDICDARGYVKPSIYQGHYNALMRSHEATLMPLLRKHGIAYYAYSPLGGGFLTGKVTLASSDSNTLARTRWAGESIMAHYPNTYDKPSIHNALRTLHTKCVAHGLELTEVSLRWIVHHSALGSGDGIILGAKRIHQLEDSVRNCRKEPLPKELVEAVETMWERVKWGDDGRLVVIGTHGDVTPQNQDTRLPKPFGRLSMI